MYLEINLVKNVIQYRALVVYSYKSTSPSRYDNITQTFIHLKNKKGTSGTPVIIQNNRT